MPQAPVVASAHGVAGIAPWSPLFVPREWDDTVMLLIDDPRIEAVSALRESDEDRYDDGMKDGYDDGTNDGLEAGALSDSDDESRGTGRGSWWMSIAPPGPDAAAKSAAKAAAKATAIASPHTAASRSALAWGRRSTAWVHGWRRAMASSSGGEPLIELWVASEKLQRVAGSWVMVLRLPTDDGELTGSRRRGSHEERLENLELLPVHSLGIRSLRRWHWPPRRRPSDSTQRVLVRVAAEDVPAGTRGLLSDEANLVGGGPIQFSTARLCCRPALAAAWAYNLSVLAYGVAFIFYAWLCLLATADAAYVRALLSNFALAVTLTLVLDVVVALLIASLPARAHSSKTPAGLCLTYLTGFLAL